MTPKEAIDFAKESGALVVDIRFTDLFGAWHHFSLPIQELNEEMFEEFLRISFFMELQSKS